MKAAPQSAAERPTTDLAGVGPALAAALAKLELHCIRDLWFHLPLRYEDRTVITPIAELRDGMRTQVEGTVAAVETGFSYRRQLRVAVTDASGGTLTLRFLHFRKTQLAHLQPGTRLRAYGEVRGAHAPEMVHPQYQRLGSRPVPLPAHLTPIYPSREGLGQQRLAAIIARALERLPQEAELELLPQDLRNSLALPGMRQSILDVHQPGAGIAPDQLLLGTHPAVQRLAFEELLAHHLSLRQLRQQWRSQAAPVLGGGNLAAQLVEQLPFALTDAQRRVGDEIAADLRTPIAMLRLVQGDVGCGKTVVAAAAAAMAIEAGHQVALMAPTELLAEQHMRSFAEWFKPLGIEPVWLAGKVKGRARQQAMDRIAEGAPLVIGTHALMQDAVSFSALGLVIVDEQHRFGVHQRLALRDKGRDGELVPHQLVLTATPIPRTLAMSAYADLDVSVIDALPPGRTPVQTVVLSSARRDEIIGRIRVACAAGRQAYWVCTLIEESEQLRAQAAQNVHAELSAALDGLRVELIHGRMAAAEKQHAMDAFCAGHAQLLVATTVIEVGVDVPNASLMVIDNAERLGLAQLHQLRGRVGRGDVESTCVLLYEPPLSAVARERLGTMRQTHDGFRIAERDLQLRGPGEVLGTRQTGELQFRIADLLRDAKLLPSVQQHAAELQQHHPEVAAAVIRRWVGAAARFVDA